jgi:GMP synthase (glutamine-hydrolysing)
MMRALVLEHESSCKLGRLEAPLARRGVAVQIVRPPDMADLPDPGTYEIVVTLGSDESAHDESLPWVDQELAYVRAAIRAEVPVLGICFGAQMLARALGADVRRASAPEVGWKTLTRTHASSSWLPAGPWFVWHEDTFDWPPDATPLAWTEEAPHAFRHGDHLGLQFHPEADADLVERWLDDGMRTLELQRVDVDALRRQTRRMEDAADAAAHALFEFYLGQVLAG